MEKPKLKVISYGGCWCVVCPEGTYARGWTEDYSYREKTGLYAYPFGGVSSENGLQKTLTWARKRIYKELRRVPSGDVRLDWFEGEA